jgi:hypothetical protein
MLTQIMNPRAAAVCGRAQADLMGDDDKPPTDGAVSQARATFRNKEGGGNGSGPDPVSQAGVRPQLLLRGNMDRKQSGFAELGLPHGEDPLGEINIRAVQTDRFPHSHARHGQQPEQGRMAGGAKIIG